MPRPKRLPPWPAPDPQRTADEEEAWRETFSQPSRPASWKPLRLARTTHPLTCSLTSTSPRGGVATLADRRSPERLLGAGPVVGAAGVIVAADRRSRPTGPPGRGPVP